MLYDLKDTREMRPICPDCHMARETCYCGLVRPFQTEALIVVLVHPREFRKRIGTARMVKLCVSNSLLIRGDGSALDHDEKLQALLRDPALWPVVLYPGPRAANLSTLAQAERARLAPAGRRLAVLIIDGTWPTAKKMLRTSRTLATLPQVAFVPEQRSRYRIRRQPGEICLSTVEAVHTVLSLLHGKRPEFENLFEVFDAMVETQIRFEAQTLGLSAESVRGLVPVAV